MKKIALLLLILILQACADDKKKTEPRVELSEEVSEDIQSLAKDEKKEEPISVRIPSYDFEAFQKKILQKSNDTTYVVNFWATWCKPCVKELPYFERINREYADKKVKVILASLDFPNKVQSQVVPFIKKNKLHSEIVLLDDADANSWIPQVSEKWSGAIPATVIYKNDSRTFYEKSFTYEELKTEIQKLL
ncbi:TlpA family protein disulfide reductase [Marixanthomonas ophiurae]|uniref:TlpA family protein disulfide reductase n=1 Tax=Marixanthomonas ophiurae TaxID=387659 RepID=A0A3E1QE85_9FLAO|nr:TlpA family protein disulfide reductase [Marixanthomonas ophiurae]RFN60414.1 TlpA family protein disulfide reductase [Marixanthomonas ophiurae]